MENETSQPASDTSTEIALSIPDTTMSAFDLLPEAVVIVQCDTGVICYSNTAATSYFGYQPADLIDQHHRVLYPDAGATGYLNNVPRVFDGAVTLLITHANGSLRPFDAVLTLTEINGKDYLLATYRPVTERSEYDQQLIDSAEYDELTGAMNRFSFINRLQQEIDRCRRYGSPMSLAMCDMDEFKAINDHHGHQAGDSALKVLVEGLRRHLRSTDLIGRFGGDEFMICLPGVNPVGARHCLKRIVEAVPDLPVPELASSLCGLSVSIGVTDWHTDIREAADLVARADAAMYKAKRKGRNRMAVWTPGDMAQWKKVA